MDSKNNSYCTLNNKTDSDIFFKKTLTTEQLKELLTKDPSIINSTDEKGETFLSYALSKNQNELYDIVINSPALNLKYKDKEGNSYLHLAVINQNEIMIKLLIKKGINLNMQNKAGNTALHIAYEHGNDSIIKILTHNGINTLIKNKENKIAKDMKEIKIKKNKSANYNTYINKTIKNNKFEYEINGNILNQRKNGNDNIKIINNKENKFNITNKEKKSININNIDTNMMLKVYSKFIKNNPNFIIEKNKKFYKNDINIDDNNYVFELSERTNKKNNIKMMDNLKINDENNIKVLYFKNYNRKRNTQEDIDPIKNLDSNNLFNNTTSKETKFITETKEKSNNIEEKSSSLEDSQFSQLINKCEKIKISKHKYKIYNKDNNKLKSNYLIYDRNHLMNKKSRDLLSQNSKSYINLINFDKWKTIQNRYSQKGINEKRNTDNILKYNITNKKSIHKSKSKKDNNLSSNKKMNKIKGFGIVSGSGLKLKNQNSFIFNTSTKKNYNNYKLNHKLKKRNINRIKNNNIYYEKNSAQDKNNNKKLLSKSKNIFIPKNRLFTHNNSINSLKNNIKNNVDEYGLTLKSSNLLKNFLSQISMDKYMSIFALNGFDDINLILEQSKNGIASIRDNELKEAGIIIPGDRAKILIRIQELSNNFNFPIPKEVYYSIENKKNLDFEKNLNIKKLEDWLKNLKIENYFNNFIKCGYYSLELLLVQMASSNPITSEILKEELKIEKIGYRSRIINKLKEDSRRYIRELEINMLVINNGDEQTDNCQCLIY